MSLLSLYPVRPAVAGPIQCTSEISYEIGSRITATHSVVPHGTFKEKEFYIGHGAYVFIYSISVSVQPLFCYYWSCVDFGDTSLLFLIPCRMKCVRRILRPCLE